MEIRPVNDRILVKPFKAPEKHGALYLPENARGEVLVGLVESVGPGRSFDGPGRTVTYDCDGGILSVAEAERSASQVKVGDVVVFGRYSGAKVEAFGRELFMLREDELLATIYGMPEDWLKENEDVVAGAGLGETPGTVVGLDGKPLEAAEAPAAEPPPIVRLD